MICDANEISDRFSSNTGATRTTSNYSHSQSRKDMRGKIDDILVNLVTLVELEVP